MLSRVMLSRVMLSTRSRAVWAGILIILGFVAGVLSIVPAVDSSDYLLKTSAHSNQVLSGALFQFFMSITYAGFAIALYPILRKLEKSLALGFLSFRIIASVINIFGLIILFLLLSLSQEFVRLGKPETSYFLILGDILRSARDVVNHVAMIFTLSIGGLMFYILLYRTILLPHWIALWGVIGTLLTIFASLLIIFNQIEVITSLYVVLNLPLIVLEIVLAIWLIVKGFNQDVLKSRRLLLR